MTGFLRSKVFTLVMMAFLALGAVGGAGVATPDKAAAAGCYDSALSTDLRLFEAYRYTAFYYTKATTNCADLNVAVTLDPTYCDVIVDAQYYSTYYGRWIDGAYDDVWQDSGYWRTPIKNVKDGTQMRVRFATDCYGSYGKIWIAS